MPELHFEMARISLTVMPYILSFIKRFEAYEIIGGLFKQTINGTMELSVTERIWDLILQIVAVIADLFSADAVEIRIIANDNLKIAIINKNYVRRRKRHKATCET